MLNFIAQTNFLDIVILVVILRICYIAAVTGLAVELFKLAGVLFATYISLHYYTGVSDLIQRYFFSKIMPLEFMDFIVFVILAIISYLGFIVLRSIFYRFIKLEAVPKINKISGFILGAARAYFTVGLLVFMLLISSVSYFNDSIRYSYLGIRAISISPRAYHWIWSSVVSKFLSKDKLNPTVEEVTEKFHKK